MADSSFLAGMARESRARVRSARRQESEAALLERALASTPGPALRLAGFDLIAELKLRSPGSGPLADAGIDRLEQVRAYAEAGAAAVSVLTEPRQFNGSLADLAAAADLLRPLGVPAMRKDFLTEPYQVLEARAAGAGGVLVIVTMLDDAQAQALLDCADELDLFVLLEAFDRRDLERIERLRPPARLLVGVNCRDLKTLEVRGERFTELASQLPPNRPCVAESGICTAADASAVARLGYRAVLVGSALMQTVRPQAAAAALIDAGRAVVGAENAACS